MLTIDYLHATAPLMSLALQALPASPLPHPMEAPVNAYVECVTGRFMGRFDRLEAQRAEALPEASTVMENAIEACAQDRARALARSERALRAMRGFERPDARLLFVQERFDFVDAMMRWSVTAEGDPDNWNPDAAD